ncbi:YjjG family noncanonical pyrimidine nucleotidase [Geofilum rhodophaeum]|uniref:YjjG family noncanonical pyrimidine nucleotidase n=1 Tax=Geofilum rhodophaeum TaxID=1965019 RepID=UPI000B524769|nr:YjjG family noncanonical pyrimidine nucleotidase [Geofilum rhodophaeum]
MPKYQHLFFDLDHTLWDFATNEQLTLKSLFQRYQLDKYFSDFKAFFATYQPINNSLWLQYRNNHITKKQLNTGRFHQTFLTGGLDNETMATNFAGDFIRENALQTTLMPHTLEVLDYLKPRYHMHIITNGFVETQQLKLDESGLSPYFERLFVSERVGAQKPRRAFFEYAIKSCNARKKESLVIGDSLDADIQGAKNFGLDHVFFNPAQIAHNETVQKEISSLRELIDWL